MASIDPTDLNADMTSGAQLFKNGHTGLLTINQTAPSEQLTTVRTSYRPPRGPDVRLKGKLTMYVIFPYVLQFNSLLSDNSDNCLFNP